MDDRVHLIRSCLMWGGVRGLLGDDLHDRALAALDGLDDLTAMQKRDCPAYCPAVDALLDILDLEAGWVHSSIREKPDNEKMAFIYSTAKKALDEIK